MGHKELFDLIDWRELLDRAQVGPRCDVRLVVPMRQAWPSLRHRGAADHPGCGGGHPRGELPCRVAVEITSVHVVAGLGQTPHDLAPMPCPHP